MMGEQNNVFDDFVLTTGNIVATVRLLVEGAITLYEDEASPLFRLGLSHDQPVAATAFEVIGTALYELRTQVMALQERHRREIGREGGDFSSTGS